MGFMKALWDPNLSPNICGWNIIIMNNVMDGNIVVIDEVKNKHTL